MAENSSGKRMSISFTLPISCQICLGKVKQPIVCPNHHVFCSACIELWLQHNQQCPTCRIPITPENPCKQIIGGQNQEDESDSYLSNPALRRARFDILYQDCENEIRRLQNANETLQNSNLQLQERLATAEKLLASKSEQTSNSTGTVRSLSPSPSASLDCTLKSRTKGWRSQSCTLLSPRSSPSASKLKSKSRSGANETLLAPKRERHDSHMSSQRDGDHRVELACEDGSDNGEVLATLRTKLKQATSTYERIKQDMDKLKEQNANLKTDNRALLMENGRLKQAAATRSPRKYEKYTSLAQQSKLDQCQREVSQLKSALERSDAYIEELETKLEDYKSQFGPLPRKRPCRTKETVNKTLETSVGELSRIISRTSETVQGTRYGKSQDNMSKFDVIGVASTSSHGCFNLLEHLKEEDDRQVMTFGRERDSSVNGIHDSERTSSFTYSNSSKATGTFAKDTHCHLLRNKTASHELVSSRETVSTVRDKCLIAKESPSNSPDVSDLEGPSHVISTPSTAMGRLSLDSSQKTGRSSSFESFSVRLEPKLKISLSCHRQLDFGKEPPQAEALQSILGAAETQGLMLEGNLLDIPPSDQNATFSDLNFTLTSELSDCAQLMKDAEKRMKSKRDKGQEGETHHASKATSAHQPNAKSSAHETVRSIYYLGRDRGKDCLAAFSTTPDYRHKAHATDGGGNCKRMGLQNDSQNFKVHRHLDNTQVTWSKSRPDHGYMRRAASTEPQEPLSQMSSTLTPTSSGLIETSHSAEYTSHSLCGATPCSGLPGTVSLSCNETKQPSIPRPTASTAPKVAAAEVNHREPAIKPQLMKVRPNADTSEYGGGMEHPRVGSRLMLGADYKRGNFDSLHERPLADDTRDEVTSNMGRPGRREDTFNLKSNDTTLAFMGMESKCFFQLSGQDKREDMKKFKERTKFKSDREDEDSQSKSPKI